MKRKAKIFWGILAILALALIFVIFSGNNFLSIIIKNGDYVYPPQTTQIVWNGVDVKLTAPSFSPLTSDSQHQFCSSEGDATISNSYSFSGDLTLISSMSSSYTGCGGNYLIANFTLPPGTLSGTCTVSASTQPQGGGSESGGECNIPGIFSKHYSINDVQQWGQGQPSSISWNFTINLTEITEIGVSLESHSSSNGNGNSKIVLSYVKTPVTCQNPPQPPCDSAVQIKDENDCFVSWDNSTCPECAEGLSKCSDGICRAYCGSNTCPESPCQEGYICVSGNCEKETPKPDYTATAIFIALFISLIMILTFVYLKIRRRR